MSNWWFGYYHASSPSQVNFLIFCAVWSILALIYLIIVPWRFSGSVAHHKFAILTAEALTMVFWFAGFIALAVFMTGRVCYGSVCSTAKAAIVFAAFSWYFYPIILCVRRLLTARQARLGCYDRAGRPSRLPHAQSKGWRQGRSEFAGAAGLKVAFRGTESKL